ncbi:hypothetical protein PYCCODRAFT_1209424 [Trametes coccinea BRFM310]|uniref:F-box domain-containing protein n=1 Tax=Trametes coccinea (strain BRFM310) TaxID=1353009 RepID=A0A1Y2I8X1_TRAC3|nr:hypothetical protein PYCCODRAFT_1209424 [Trametes coccinea BRFM310]
MIPWPELESLTLSWIDPREQLFAHLPATLRELRLRVWPRHYYLYLRPTWAKFREGGQPAAPSWAFDLPSPLSLMRVIQQCRIPTLECLDLEYEVAEDHIPMLRSIAQSFPKLQSLHLYPYRSEDDLSEVPSERMSEALSPLQSLQTLRLFLDIFHLHGYSPLPRGRNISSEVDKLLNTALHHFSGRLSCSLTSLHILLVSDLNYTWHEYRVARDPTGSPLVYMCDIYRPTHNVIGIADCE